MADIDQTKNTKFDICWARGDDDPKIFTIKDSSACPVDVSQQTFSMAVNTEKDPSDISNQIFQVSGVFVNNGSDGQISFTPPANSLDNVTAPGSAFYDIQRITPSKKTIVKGKVIFIMDIDKS